MTGWLCRLRRGKRLYEAIYVFDSGRLIETEEQLRAVVARLSIGAELLSCEDGHALPGIQALYRPAEMPGMMEGVR